MKYLFAQEDSGIPVERVPAEKIFVQSEAPQSLTDDVRREAEKLTNTVRRAVPRALTAVKNISMLIAFLILASLVRALTDIPFLQAYHNVPWLFWVGGAAAVIFLACLCYERIRIRRLSSDDLLGQGLDRAIENLKTHLEVPGNTSIADILRFSYEQTDTGISFHGPAVNKAVELYRCTDGLCLFDGTAVYLFPLEGAVLRVIHLGVPIDGSSWNKEEGPNSKVYRRYGVMASSAGQIGLRYSCALDVIRDGETYRMLFPAYELDAFQSLTGLPAPTLPETGQTVSAAESFEGMGPFGGPVRPRFYWRLPKKEAGAWFAASSDVEFRAQHPALYGVLVVLGITAFILPVTVFALAATRVMGAEFSGWLFLGIVGGLMTGAGLFNLVAAWLHQYLGHVFTLFCLVGGCALMVASWLLML